MTVYHEDAPGQANGRFGHRDDWSKWCSICAADDEAFSDAFDASQREWAVNVVDELFPKDAQKPMPRGGQRQYGQERGPVGPGLTQAGT